MYVLTALSPFTNSMTCPKSYFADTTARSVSYFERCTRFVGEYDEEATNQWRKMYGQSLVDLGGMEQIIETVNDLDEPMALEDGVEAVEAAQVEKLRSWARETNSTVTAGSLGYHVDGRDSASY